MPISETYFAVVKASSVPSQVLHEYWMVLRNHVSAIDELGMATERLRVRLPDEPKPKLLHIIEPHEVKYKNKTTASLID